ncbi:MAG TPA: hypothetical protein ENN75_04060 [candidate division Zixibacteria bacterium]|nr:hypothetical protein [candidate division Zixibacteria bacterium]
MRLILFSIILLAVFNFACEDASAKVDPDSDISNLANITYIAMDPDGGLKSVAFADSVVDGDSVLIYREMGIDVVWEMEVIFRKSPWCPLYMMVYSESIQGELFWDGNRVTGDAIDDNGATQSIDKTIDGLSIHAWFLQAAFLGFPFEQEDSYMEFQMITPQLSDFPYKAELTGTEGVGTSTKWFNCYKLAIDGRGVYAPFTPDVRVFHRVEEPRIPIQLWVQNEGAVFEWFADSL